MAEYRLNVTFKEEDLNLIYETGEKVVIVKHTEGNADSQVAWVSFSPFRYNTIDWKTEFAVYASTTDVQNGATINMMSDKLASPKIVYNFEKGHFRNPTSSSSLSVNTYAVANNYPLKKVLTFGLAQEVVINDEAFPNKPINAILVPYGQSAQMTPIEKIDVFLLRDIETSTVVSKIMSESITITYRDSVNVQTIEYNGDTGKFFIR